VGMVRAGVGRMTGDCGAAWVKPGKGAGRVGAHG